MATLTPNDIHTINTLAMASSKAETLCDILGKLLERLPEGTTQEVIQAAQRNLHHAHTALRHEAEALGRWGSAK